MGTILLVLVTLAYLGVCGLLIIVVLMQEGKGGGLSGMLSGGASPLSETLGAFGAEQTLRKWTKWAAVGFMVLAIFLTTFGPMMMRPRSLATGAAPVQAPAAPTAAPEAPAAAPEASPTVPQAAPVAPAPTQAAPAAPEAAPAGQ